MEGILVILIFFAVIALTSIIFVVWVIASIVRMVLRGVAGTFAPEPPKIQSTPNVRTCTNGQCRSSNPSTAQFCRRCGKALSPAVRVNVQRAACL